MADKVSRDEYDRLLTAAKSRGGWYSRAWGKTPGGFAFLDESAANEFAGSVSPASSTEPEQCPAEADPFNAAGYLDCSHNTGEVCPGECI